MPAEYPTDEDGNLREPSIPETVSDPTAGADGPADDGIGDVRSLLERIAEGVDRLAEQEQQRNTAEPDRAAADELLSQTLAKLAEAVEKLAGEPEQETTPDEPDAGAPDTSPPPEAPPESPPPEPSAPPATPTQPEPAPPEAPQPEPASGETNTAGGFDEIATLLSSMLEVSRESIELQREATGQIERMANQLNDFTIALAQQLLDRQVQSSGMNDVDDVWLG